MKIKRWKKQLLQTLCGVCIGLLFTGTVYAADYTVKITLPVRQQVVIENEAAESVRPTGVYELSAAEKDFPMPEGSKNGSYVFSIEGNDKQADIPLSYTHAGVYVYTLRQITADAAYYTYDKTVYTVTAYIQNDPSGGLTCQLIMENAHKEKCGEAVFRNSYHGPKTDDSSESPSTGEENDVALWVTLGVLSLAVMRFLSVAVKKRSR